jgi:uncharacterized protein
MRIVLDTNILARVVMSPFGPARELFELIRSDHVLVTSLDALAELSRVLAYERVRRIHGLGDKAIEEFVERLAAGSLVVALPETIARVVPQDPDDDILVATAVAGGADIICTRNRHFYHEDVIAYCGRHRIKVMEDVAALALLRQEGFRG